MVGLLLGIGGFGLGGFSGGGFVFGGCLVALAAVIGDVEAGALEDEPRAHAELPLHLALAPGFLASFVLGTGGQGVILHRLKNLKILLTLGTFVLVGGHCDGTIVEDRRLS